MFFFARNNHYLVFGSLIDLINEYFGLWGGAWDYLAVDRNIIWDLLSVCFSIRNACTIPPRPPPSPQKIQNCSIQIAHPKEKLKSKSVFTDLMVLLSKHKYIYIFVVPSFSLKKLSLIFFKE